MHGSMGFRATVYGSYKKANNYPSLKCHENEEKIDNDLVLRIAHRIKNTQPILNQTWYLSFLEDNVLSDKIKIWYIFEYQSNENWAFRFFGTPGIDKYI